MTDMNSCSEFTKQICDICFDILVRSGPFMKETIYQDLLIHELNKIGIATTRELVFNYRFMDSEGKPVTICNNQFLRTDIEIPIYECILEMKCTTTATKEEQLWQLRNYLENRDERKWGILINFINKFGARTSPKVQCDLLYKSDKYHEIDACGKTRLVRQYQTWTTESIAYPTKDEIIIKDVVLSKPAC